MGLMGQEEKSFSEKELESGRSETDHPPRNRGLIRLRKPRIYVTGTILAQAVYCYLRDCWLFNCRGGFGIVLDELPTDSVFEDTFYAMIRAGFRPTNRWDRIIIEAKAVFSKTFIPLLYCRKGGDST